jgi:hypothetical protein
MVHNKAQTIYATTENVAATRSRRWPSRLKSTGLWSTSPLRTSWAVEQRALKALMISYSPLVTTENRIDWEDHATKGLDSGGIDLSDLHEGSSRMILSSPTFRKTSSVYGRCDRFACAGSALPTLDLDTTHLYGEQAPAPMTRRSSTSTCSRTPSSAASIALGETGLHV